MGFATNESENQYNSILLCFAWNPKRPEVTLMITILSGPDNKSTCGHKNKSFL